MKWAVNLVIGLVALIVTFVLGMIMNETLIHHHCVNDFHYTNIGGEQFACINRAQFEERFLQFMDGGTHGKDGNT